MVNLKKLTNYLYEKNLNIEEFWLLYNIMIQQLNISDGIYKVSNNEIELNSISQIFRIYIEKNNFVIINKDIGTRSEQILSLENRGFIEVFTREKEIKITDIKIMPLFIDDFLVNDIEKAFNEFLELYPKVVSVNGKSYPTMDKSKSELVKRFSIEILNGCDAILFQRFMLITEMYINEHSFNDSSGRQSALCKISKYLDEFDGVAAIYENENFNSSSTGRIIK